MVGRTISAALYEVTSSGTEQLLYSFAGSTDGDIPLMTLIFDKKGNLYGTAFSGGNPGPCYINRGCGFVFKLVP